MTETPVESSAVLSLSLPAAELSCPGSLILNCSPEWACFFESCHGGESKPREMWSLPGTRRVIGPLNGFLWREGLRGSCLASLPKQNLGFNFCMSVLCCMFPYVCLNVWISRGNCLFTFYINRLVQGSLSLIPSFYCSPGE